MSETKTDEFNLSEDEKFKNLSTRQKLKLQHDLNEVKLRAEQRKKERVNND